MIMLIIALLSCLLIFIISMLIAGRAQQKKVEVTERIGMYAAANEENEDDKSLRSYALKGMAVIRLAGSRLKGLPQAEIFEIKMQQAGLPLLGSEFLAIMGFLAAAAFIVALIFGVGFFGALWLGLLMPLILSLYIKLRISRRRTVFNEQLGDALIMMANALRSGMSFMQAIDMVSREMTAPIGTEFAKLLSEMRLGIPTEEGLNNLSRRVVSSDLDLVIVAVMINRQVGGNLARIFDTISETIRERIRLKREINTLTAQGRMSGWILGALPFALALLLQLMSPGYLQPLFDDPIGLILIGAGLVSMTIGILVIRSIVNIDV